jgi:hypothetical protein
MATPTDLVIDIAPSSRQSEEGAGWRNCTGSGSWQEDVLPGTKSLSLLRPSTLWQSRNDIIARFIADPTAAARTHWVQLARLRARQEGTHADFVISRPTGDTVSILLIGDTGEGDNSQYAVAEALAEMSKSADFAILCSDVIYPTGDLNDYARKFHHPYRNIQLSVYAVPGNHDWYDGLHGFMHYFCQLNDNAYIPQFGRGLAARLAGKLWRKTPQPATSNPASNSTVLQERRPPRPLQPAPYFAIDTGPVRLVGIDTGIAGEVDEEQYCWLQRVSLDAARRPKILLTGKPIYVDGEHHPGRVAGTTATVDDVVTNPLANYVMVIGGDIHNYQRYPVPIAENRTIQYLVSGGGGAYMHATHRIPPVDINGVDESTFRCYPLRRDSLARFSEAIDAKIFRGCGAVAIDAPTAGKYYQQQGITTNRSSRPVAQRLSPGDRIKAAIVHRIPAGRLFHRFGSEAFDFDDPPFFKQFLRIHVGNNNITVTCFGVTGCADTEHSPSIEDQFTIVL